MKTPHSATNNYVPGSLKILDGLRGFAALYVMIYHVRAFFWAGWATFAPNLSAHTLPEIILAMFLATFRYGAEMVMLFFVLSGFVIHYRQAVQQVQAPVNQFNWRAYLQRRLLRLYPPLLFALALTWALDTWGQWINPGFYSGATRPETITSLEPVLDYSWATFLGNTLFIQSLWAKTYGTNGPLWSLAYEFFFYLIYPLILPFYRRWGSLWVLGGALLLGGLSYGVGLSGLLSFFPWKLAPYFAIWWMGAVCADWYAQKRLLHHPNWVLFSSLGLLAGVLLVARERVSIYFYTLGQGFAFGGLFVYLLLPAPKTWGRQWLQRVFQWLAPTAAFSYTLYLTHLPLAAWLGAVYLFYFKELPLDFSFVIVGIAICLLFAVGVAWLVERPFVSTTKAQR